MLATDMTVRSASAKLGFSRDGFMSTALLALQYIDRVSMWSAAMHEHQIFPNTAFPWTLHLEASTPAIRAEAEALLQDRMSVPSAREISPDHAKIAVGP